MAKIFIQTTSGEWIAYEFGTPITSVGRHASNHIVVDHASVSAHHAEIVHDEDGYRIYDLHSFNGTVVNGELVREALLKDEDIICFASVPGIFKSTPESHLRPVARIGTHRRSRWQTVLLIVAGFAAGAAATLFSMRQLTGTFSPALQKTSRSTGRQGASPANLPILGRDDAKSLASKQIGTPATIDRLQHLRNAETFNEVYVESMRRVLLERNKRFAELSEQIRTEEAWINEQIDDAWRAGRVFESSYTREMAAERFKANLFFLNIKKHERDGILRKAVAGALPAARETVDARQHNSEEP